MKRLHKIRFGCVIGVTLLLSACGGSDNKISKLPGNRIAIMHSERLLDPDESLKNVTPALGEPIMPQAWPQEGGGVSAITSAFAFSAGEKGKLNQRSASIGDGEGWSSAVAPSPVIYDDTVYAMDAVSYVSAHRFSDIKDRLWKNDTLVAKEERITLGGGLAVADDTLYVVSGMGHAMALERSTGKKIWNTPLKIPVRSAPRLIDDQLLILTIDNQLFSLNIKSGAVQWVHQGIATSSGYISSATVAVAQEDALLVVPHSSGDVFALQQRNGRPIWNDNIGKVHHTRASSLFGGIHASPVIVGNIAYTIASDGLMVAARVQDGRILWQRELSALHTPAVAGDTAFVLATNGQLVALHRFDGRVRWATNVSALDEDDERLGDGWHAPMVVKDEIWLVHRNGTWLVLSALTGEIKAQRELDEGIATTPLFVNNAMIVIYQDATLSVYRAK